MQCSPNLKMKRCWGGVSAGSSSRSHSSPIPVAKEKKDGWERHLCQSYLLSPALLATGRSRRTLRWKTQRFGVGTPVQSLVRALALSVAFSTAIMFAGMNPVVQVADAANQLELHLQSPPLQTVAPSRGLEPETKKWNPKELMAPVLDKIAAVKVDGDTEDEYWVFDKIPFSGQFRILRKETTALEIILSGFVAGFLVELTNALLLHPIDTFKTRLQSSAGLAVRNPALLYQRLYDGLVPVLATVPALSIFWAVKDIVRKTLIVFIRAKLPSPVADVISSTFASACGEAAYVAVKTPGEVLKINQQAALLDEDSLRQRYSEEDNSYTSRSFQFNPYFILEESLRSFPILCTVEVPQVAVRTAIFVALHDSSAFPSGAGSDILVFTIASAVASLLCTPLDVARTQLVLRREGVQNLSTTLQNIGEREGISGLMAGWLPRLLWNGLIVGSILGLCRLQYEDARAFFMVGVLDKFENIVQPVSESIW